MRVSNKLASLDASFIYFAFSRKKRCKVPLADIRGMHASSHTGCSNSFICMVWTYVIEQQGDFIVVSNPIGRFKF